MQIGNHFVLEKTVTGYRQFFSSLIIDEVIFGMKCVFSTIFSNNILKKSQEFVVLEIQSQLCEMQAPKTSQSAEFLMRGDRSTV